MRHNAFLGTLTISATEQQSSAYDETIAGAIAQLGSTVDFIIQAPATMTGTSAAVQISLTSPPTSADYVPLYIGGTAVTVGPGQAVVVPAAAVKGIRVYSNAAEASSRTFLLSAQTDMA